MLLLHADYYQQACKNPADSCVNSRIDIENLA